MTGEFKKFRRLSGMARFEKNSRLTHDVDGRLVKAWRVPGTAEAGKHNMFLASFRLWLSADSPDWWKKG